MINSNIITIIILTKNINESGDFVVVVVISGGGGVGVSWIDGEKKMTRDLR